MDTSDILKTLLSADTVKGISQKTGASSKDVKNVLTSALPALISGAQKQSEDTKSGFDKALSEHAAVSTNNLGAFFKNVDLSDGAKILGHLLGGKTGSTEAQTAKETGVSKDGVNDILAAASPLLMSLLGKQTAGSGDAKGQLIGSLLGSLVKNVDVKSLAGSLLGVGSNTEGNEKKKAAEAEKTTAKKTTTTAKKTTTTAKKTTTTAKKTTTTTAKKTTTTAKKEEPKKEETKKEESGLDKLTGFLTGLLK